MARSSLAKLAWAFLVLAPWWLAACAQTAPGRLVPGSQDEQRAMLSAIKGYYENNAVEEGNVCKSPLLDGVTRSEVISRDGNEVVVELRYKYSRLRQSQQHAAHCTGFGNRTFTLARDGGTLSRDRHDRRGAHQSVLADLVTSHGAEWRRASRRHRAVWRWFSAPGHAKRCLLKVTL